jgi:hypothetical protein
LQRLQIARLAEQFGEYMPSYPRIQTLHPLAQFLFQLGQIQCSPKLLCPLLDLGFQLTNKIL